MSLTSSSLIALACGPSHSIWDACGQYFDKQALAIYCLFAFKFFFLGFYFKSAANPPSPSLVQSDMIELKAKKRLLELWGKDGPTEYGKHIYCRVSSRIKTRKNAWLRKEIEGKVKELMRSKMMVGRYRATRCIKKKKQTQKIWAEALNRIEKGWDRKRIGNG